MKNAIEFDSAPTTQNLFAIECDEPLDKRQRYKASILEEHYKAEIEDALARRLSYVKAGKDSVTIGLQDENGKGIGKLIDTGDRITAEAGSDEEIQAMISLAKAKGWKTLKFSGTDEFKKRASQMAVEAGFEIKGYKPTPQPAGEGQKPKTGSETPDPHEQSRLAARKRVRDTLDGTRALDTPQVPAHSVAQILTEMTAGQSSPMSRWLDPLANAKRQLFDEHKAAQARLAEIPEVDLKKLEKDLAAKQGGDEYKAALQAFKDADAKAKSAGALTRKRAEGEKETAWQAFLSAHAKALAMPAAAACLTKAQQHNQERERITAALIPVQMGISQIQYLESAIEKGRDPEAEFQQAWKYRKQRPLQRWQELVIMPVFEADAARERAKLQADAAEAEAVKTQSRQAQTEREIAAQKMADFINDKLSKQGLPADQEEVLQEQHRYYLALADGCNEEEAWEHARKSTAPRP